MKAAYDPDLAIIRSKAGSVKYYSDYALILDKPVFYTLASNSQLLDYLFTISPSFNKVFSVTQINCNHNRQNSTSVALQLN